MINGNHRTRQHGATTLAVVMVLFFIMAMVAAYTNRNLVFEQRTSANSYRAARSATAADAAADWAIAMLNTGNIGAACSVAGAGSGDKDFRSRYLTVDESGVFRPITWVASPSTPSVRIQAQPSCSGNADGGWACSCPPSPSATLSEENSQRPVFTVGFIDESPPGVVALKIRACNSARSGTVDGGNMNTKGSCHINDLFEKTDDFKAYINVDAMSMVRVSLGLVSALPVVPTAALTVAGSIAQDTGTTLTATNADPLTGLALNTGKALPSSSAVRVSGPAGGTSDPISQSNTDLRGIAGDNFFLRTLGMKAEPYRQQPAAVDCKDCTDAAAVLNKYNAGSTRIIFIEGNLDLDSTSEIGTADAPAMVVVTGNVNVLSPIAFNGVLFVGGNLEWTAAASKGLLRGAAIVGGDFTGKGDAIISYDRKIVQKVHKGYGSLVRVPGSWITES